MQLFYTDHFVLPLPTTHRFPMLKYSRLRERVSTADLVGTDNLRVPDAATNEQLMLAHQPDYIRRVADGELTRQEVKRIGFPWSRGLVERSRRSVGGTISACQSALECGVGGNLAGGTHHAFADRGEGYCVFNDAVVAARVLQSTGHARRIAIIDCDVHQGNGSAAMTVGDPTIFTFSIHGEKNWPHRKEQSDLDVGLPDGTEDEAYLVALRAGIDQTLTQAEPELVIYVAGADPYHADTLGRLRLSKSGLAQRDRLVIESCRERGIPVAVCMAGGYSPNIEDIVDIHFQTLRTLREFAD
ncbi:histone deacetylase family protein [Thalassoroseus pseudoceratinae]|uniref:histone deacetylase family protein n=1 Tax=Thalassoroseus pseudoceratinae TaxID=2713176 RepID=UPI001421B026